MTSCVVRFATLLLATSALVVAACGDSTAPLPQGTFFSYESSPGDYIGSGQSNRYTLADGRWQPMYAAAAGYEVIAISVDMLPGGARWHLHFASPEGKSLIGTHGVARGLATPDVAGLDISGNSNGCNDVTGHFVVRSMVLGPGNSVDRFWATFEQHCEGASPALRGEISIVANPWR